MDPNVKTVQNMFGKGGRGRLRLRHWHRSLQLFPKKFYTKELSQFSKYRFHNQSASSHKGYPSLSILLFFNICQNAFDSTPLPFEHVVEFSFDGVGSTLHCSKI